MTPIQLKRRRMADAHLKCAEAARLFAAHARKPLFSHSEEFRATTHALDSAAIDLASSLATCQGRPRNRRIVTLLLSTLWGRATALCGQAFCHDMAAHLCRKLSIMLGVLARDEQTEGDQLLATRLANHADGLKALADAHLAHRR